MTQFKALLWFVFWCFLLGLCSEQAELFLESIAASLTTTLLSTELIFVVVALTGPIFSIIYFRKGGFLFWLCSLVIGLAVAPGLQIWLLSLSAPPRTRVPHEAYAQLLIVILTGYGLFLTHRRIRRLLPKRTSV